MATPHSAPAPAPLADLDPHLDPVTHPLTDPHLDPVTNPLTDPHLDPVTNPLVDAAPVQTGYMVNTLDRRFDL